MGYVALKAVFYSLLAYAMGRTLLAALQTSEPRPWAAPAALAVFLGFLVVTDVQTFFDNWGEQACIINGIEVPSVAHETCRRLMLTGASLPGHPCWSSTIVNKRSSRSRSFSFTDQSRTERKKCR